MEQPSLVYPAHPTYELFRDIARNTPLMRSTEDAGRVAFAYQPYKFPIPWEMNGAIPINPNVKSSYALNFDFWYERGGLNSLSYLKDTNDYYNQGLRLDTIDKYHHNYLGGKPGYPRYFMPTAHELLGFGAGALRLPVPERTNPLERTSTPKRVDSTRAQNPMFYEAYDTAHSRKNRALGAILLESTGLVMGEQYGELEQLVRRKDEKEFTAAYYLHLIERCKNRQLTFRDFERNPMSAATVSLHGPEGLRNHPLSIARAQLAHLQSGRYKDLPESAEQMLERAEELLSQIVIDTNPIEVSPVIKRSPVRMKPRSSHLRLV